MSEKMSGNNGLQKSGGLEEQIGERNGIVDADVADVLNEFRDYVCQVLRVTSSGSTAIGTGFLVGRNKVLTNFHVVEIGDAEEYECRFDVRSKGPNKVSIGKPLRVKKIITSSPYSDIEKTGYDYKSSVHPKADKLDYALLEIESHPKDRDWLNLLPVKPKIHPDSKVYVLQHPKRMPLNVAADKIAEKQPLNAARFRYLTDTEKGSSGSPCFCWTIEDENGNCSLVLKALHNFGDPGSEFRESEFNHGIPIHLIAQDLENKGKLEVERSPVRSLVQSVLATGDNDAVLAIIAMDAEIVLRNDPLNRDALTAIRLIEKREVSASAAAASAASRVESSPPSRSIVGLGLVKILGISGILILLSILAWFFIFRFKTVLPESNYTFSKLGDGWVTVGQVATELTENNTKLQNPKLQDFGKPETVDKYDISLFDVDIESLDLDKPMPGQDVILTGYPTNSFFPKSYKGRIFITGADETSWIVKMDDKIELPIGMEGGIVRDERNKQKLGIMLYHSPPTDIDIDGKLDYSYSFVAFSDVFEHLNRPSEEVKNDVSAESETVVIGQLPQIKPYNPNFVGNIPVPLPTLTSNDAAGNLLNGAVFDYFHYSLVIDERRAMPLYVAYNIDRDQLVRAPRGMNTWIVDERVPRDLQRGNGIYVNNDWDRGHLARRVDLAWGTAEEAELASAAAYFYTNSVPQYKHFNRSGWLALEEFVLEGYQSESSLLSVFTGPVHRNNDFEYRGSRIPRSFWKVVIANDPENSRNILVSAYIMDQYEIDDQNRMTLLSGVRNFDPQTYQISLEELEGLTPLRFGILKDYDSLQ